MNDEGAVYQDEAVTIAEFLLKPDVPQRHKNKFVKYWAFISHLSAVSNITSMDIHKYMIRMQRVAQLFNMGNYEYGYELCGRTMAELQFSRGKDGFYTIQSATTRTVNTVKDNLRKSKKDTWGASLKKVFGTKEKETTYEGEE